VRQRGGRDGAGLPGLVSFTTSVTHPPSSPQEPPEEINRVFRSGTINQDGSQEITLYRHEGRLKRMRGSVRASAELLHQEAHTGGYRTRAVLVTLTYRPDVDWGTRQVTAFIRCVRAWLVRRGAGCRFVWVLELTQAARPHYHVLFWLPKGLTLPKPDKQGWWPWGLTRIEWARSAVGYLVKYASKGVDGTQLPKGARLHGCGGLSAAGRSLRTWRLCPVWVQECLSVEDRPVRARGGGWVSRLTGQFEPARWRLAGHCPRWSWVRFAPVPLGAAGV